MGHRHIVMRLYMRLYNFSSFEYELEKNGLVVFMNEV